jgi:membrane-bound lytic murein transglycosylase D
MLRAQRRKGNYEAIFNGYRSRIFKFASRNFYSEFLAAREAARDYRLYFGELALDRPLSRETVVMAGYGSLPQIARQLNLKLSELAKLNPALRNPVLRGQKYVPRGFHLNLPARSDREWLRNWRRKSIKTTRNAAESIRFAKGIPPETLREFTG